MQDFWVGPTPCQEPCGGIAPDGGVPHDKEVQNPSKHRRARIAELRSALIRAHPDHGGTAETLQEALAALRAERSLPRVPITEPLAPPQRRPRRPPQPPPRTVQGAAAGVLKSVLWVYGVALPLALALALLVARANASLIGS
jgi:hypothetical protein